MLAKCHYKIKTSHCATVEMMNEMQFDNFWVRFSKTPFFQAYVEHFQPGYKNKGSLFVLLGCLCLDFVSDLSMEYIYLLDSVCLSFTCFHLAFPLLYSPKLYCDSLA
ncbi:hypothetical protein QQG55_6565 [Brugia pahangi]